MTTVSDTAYAIAFMRARESELAEGQRLFEDPYARIFAAAAGPEAREGTERFLALPFFLEGIRLRTRHIDDVVRDAITRGARQLVLMGAGFDARALRLPEVAEHDVQTFEIDLPALLETKRRLLERSGVAIPGSVHYVAAHFVHDFEARLVEDLVARGFDRGRSTMFVWEGVTAYIGPKAIDDSLHFMASIGAAGSRLIFDYSEYVVDSVPAPERARRAGFANFQGVGLDELWRRHLPGEPHPSAQIAKLGVASK